MWVSTNVSTTNLEDYYCTRHFVSVLLYYYVDFQERESQKLKWLQRCVEELGNEKWVIPALKQMREICLLYLEVCVYVLYRYW